MQNSRSDYMSAWSGEGEVPFATANTRQERLHQPVIEVRYSIKDAELDRRISVEEKKLFREVVVSEVLIALNQKQNHKLLECDGFELVPECKSIYNKLQRGEQRRGILTPTVPNEKTVNC